VNSKSLISIIEDISGIIKIELVKAGLDFLDYETIKNDTGNYTVYKYKLGKAAYLKIIDEINKIDKIDTILNKIPEYKTINNNIIEINKNIDTINNNIIKINKNIDTINKGIATINNSLIAFSECKENVEINKQNIITTEAKITALTQIKKEINNNIDNNIDNIIKPTKDKINAKIYDIIKYNFIYDPTLKPESITEEFINKIIKYMSII